MNRGSGLKLAVVILLVVAAVFFSITPIMENTNLGLDLQGGAQVVLKAVPSDGRVISDDDMSQLTSVMRKRVDEIGVSEPVIQREGDDRLIIELAGVDDPETAIKLLGQTAQLEFKDPSGAIVVTGADLKDAKAQLDGNTNKSEVVLEFNEEGAKKFGAATARLIGQPINIYLDGVLIQSPNVQTAIMDGVASISGGYADFEEAANMAALLKGGALPVNVEILSMDTVGPTLGNDSLQKSLYAALIGMIVLILFMILYYRLPGVIAAISLTVYSLILLWCLNLINATLTLPGIAGFILSIGMAVDANIIIYERIKEELRSGKSLRAGIESGFKRAFGTILDSNITTLIAALVLFKFGTGSIQGFAITLSIGLVASMFTAITFTKLLLTWASGIKAFANKKFYGA